MRDQEYLSQHLLWIGISFGIVFAILSYVPFPFSIPIAIVSFFIIIFYIRKKVVKKINSRARMFGSSSNTNQSLNYYCMACGTKHNDAACPRCGSKMKRVGSWYDLLYLWIQGIYSYKPYKRRWLFDLRIGDIDKIICHQ